MEEERISLIELINTSSGNFSKPLDAMKEYLEERIGVKGLEAAYNIIKESCHDTEYEEIYKRFDGFLSNDRLRECVPLIHSLVFLESYV